MCYGCSASQPCVLGVDWFELRSQSLLEICIEDQRSMIELECDAPCSSTLLLRLWIRTLCVSQRFVDKTVSGRDFAMR